MIPRNPSTEATPVQVVDRWNSWVRVLFPETGETTWVDLSETDYRPLDAAPCGEGPGHGGLKRDG